MYESFEHTADLGLRARAADLPTLFAEAARALFSTIVVNLSDVQPRETLLIQIESGDLALLLFDWLSELLYMYEVRHFLFADFTVEIAGGVLHAEVRGEAIDPHRHWLDHEVKAITYHGLKVEREEAGWLAEVIVDI
jgi:SHS2 domain-containing protein